MIIDQLTKEKNPYHPALTLKEFNAFLIKSRTLSNKVIFRYILTYHIAAACINSEIPRFWVLGVCENCQNFQDIHIYLTLYNKEILFSQYHCTQG